MKALAIAALLACAACSALTQSQVRAVNDFASATDGYEELPPQMLRAWDDLRLQAGELAVTTVDTRNVDVLGELQKKVDQSLEFSADADELHGALGILKTYTDLLKTVASDDFSDKLEARAKDLGGSLDRAVAQYNQHFEHKVPSLAGIAAAAVDAAGGVFLRVRQGNYLKALVPRADAALPKLLQHVQQMVALFDAGAEADRLQGIYKALAAQRSSLSLDETRTIADLLRKEKAAAKLQAAIEAATQSFLAAHQRLAESLQEKHDLKGRLEPILDLADRVKKAAALKSQFR